MTQTTRANARTMALVVMATFLSAGLAGCLAPNDGDSSSASGAIAFFVKDAPADELSEFHVTFSKVEVHQAGGGDDADSAAEEDVGSAADPEPEGNETSDDNETAPSGNQTVDDNQTAEEGNETAPSGNETVDDNQTADDNETATDDGNETVGGDDTAADAGAESADAESGWIVVVDESHTVDLKTFTGDARAFLGDATVPAGTYTQIRIHVDEAWGILAEDGSRVNVTVPSGAIKIVRPWTVDGGETTELTVDFLLEDSLINAGQSGKWVFKPVMKIAVDHVGGDADASSDDGDVGADEEDGDGPPGNKTHGPPENPGSQGRP